MMSSFAASALVLKDVYDQVLKDYRNLHSTINRMLGQQCVAADIASILEVVTGKFNKLEEQFFRLQDKLIEVGVHRDPEDPISVLARERFSCEQELWDMQKRVGMTSSKRPEIVPVDDENGSSRLEETNGTSS